MDFNEGAVLLIDKPYTWTSFDVVKKLKLGLKIKKIGHAGTLDPLATGLLVICTGKMTKKIDNYQAKEKEYTGEFVIGRTTPSIDLETPFDSEADISHITEADIRAQLRNFLGTIEQIPPMFSAIKVNGQRVYVKARKGEEVVINARKVFIKEFLLTEVNLPSLKFKIICSKGTYIRSIVKDFGEKLKTGAYLKDLRRTRIGKFSINDAELPIEFINRLKDEQKKKIDDNAPTIS